jgi:hypothetical protein
VIHLTADDRRSASDQRDVEPAPGPDSPPAPSRTSASAQGLTFATALTLTAGLVFGATEGALAKLLGVPLAVVMAFLCVRAATYRGSMRGARRDVPLIAGVLTAVALSAGVAVASLTASPGPGPDTSTTTHTKRSSNTQSALSRHVPAAFRVSCQRIPSASAPGQSPAGTVAALSCSPDVGAKEVRYYQWFSATLMDETFRFWLTTGSNFCKLDGKTLRPRDYSAPNASGRVYCVDIGNGEVILNWTIDELRVNAEAHADRSGLKALYEWWKGGGLWS